MPIRKILAAVDFSDQSNVVVEKAAEAARAFGVPVDILHVVAPEPDFVGYPPFAYPGRDERADELRKEKSALKGMVDRLEAAGVTARAFMKEAPTSEGVVDFAEKHGADLIVIGTHSKGLLERLLIGSSTNAILKRSGVPVLVVPPPEDS